MNEKQEIEINGDILEIIPLGAAREVGRSCIFLKFKGKQVLFDCGIHPGFVGYQALPYFDEINPAEIDLLLVTHFHNDHCAALPYLLAHTDFKGEIFMTHPTKAIYKLVISDYVKVSNVAIRDMLYDEKDLLYSMQRIKLIDYHQVLHYNGITFTCYAAGHVLGACMFLLTIDGINILYTGDFSREKERSLRPAQIPIQNVDVLIMESTYGSRSHESRSTRQFLFSQYVYDIIHKKKGRCLLPVFAIGQAQELLLILDELWKTHAELREVPVFYVSSLAMKAVQIFHTFQNMMPDPVKAQFERGKNPFEFQFVQNIKNMEQFDDTQRCVVMASPGMLQSGISRDLFEKWAPNETNGVVITGYCIERTPARRILSGEPPFPDDPIPASANLEVKLSVQYTSFAAHADRQQILKFVQLVKPKNIILVHGDVKQMLGLRNAVNEQHGDNITVVCPENCQPVHFEFSRPSLINMLGSIAQELSTPSFLQSEGLMHTAMLPAMSGSDRTHEDIEIRIDPPPVPMLEDGKQAEESKEQTPSNYVPIKGVLMKNGLEHIMVAPNELAEYTDFHTISMRQRQYIQCSYTLQILRNFLLSNFTIDFIELRSEGGVAYLSLLDGAIKVFINEDQGLLTLEWIASPDVDLIADSVALSAYQLTQMPDSHLQNEINKRQERKDADAKAFGTLVALLREKYYVELEDKVKQEIKLRVRTAKSHTPLTAKIKWALGSVECEDETLKEQLEQDMMNLKILL